MPELVMVIEDEKEIRDLVRYNLERAGYRVNAVADGEAGLQQVFESHPDALVLDLMLPGRSGLEILREIRGEPSTRELPVLVLSARSAEMDKLLGFEHGADDYLTKPFGPRELIARVQALLRRSQPSRAPGQVVVGELRIEALAREAMFRGKTLTLTPREFELLLALVRAPGRVFTRTELIERALGHDFEGLDRTIDVHVRNLRRKIEADPSAPRLVETVPGVGYRFTAGDGADA